MVYYLPVPLVEPIERKYIGEARCPFLIEDVVGCCAEEQILQFGGKRK
jgi:hypothetical protein